MAIEIEVQSKRFVVPERDDPCNLWQTYFSSLKDELGEENAKTIWLVTWSKNGSAACTTNPKFNKFLDKNDLDVAGAGARMVADLSAIGGNIRGLGKSLTKVIAIGVPVALSAILLGILIVLFNTAKNSDAKDIAMLHPGLKSANLLGK